MLTREKLEQDFRRYLQMHFIIIGIHMLKVQMLTPSETYDHQVVLMVHILKGVKLVM